MCSVDAVQNEDSQASQDESSKNETPEESDQVTFNEKQTSKKRLGKNPDVDTSFLPDRDREDEENRLRLVFFCI
jgi:protein FAM50